jgi:hypothetical protein
MHTTLAWPQKITLSFSAKKVTLQVLSLNILVPTSMVMPMTWRHHWWKPLRIGLSEFTHAVSCKSPPDFVILTSTSEKFSTGWNRMGLVKLRMPLLLHMHDMKIGL